MDDRQSIVCFDFCNTLVDSKQIDRETINETLRQFGKQKWSITRRKKEPEKSMKENFSNFFNQQAEKAYEHYLNRLIERCDELNFFDGSLELINMLKNNGVIVAVLSNRDRIFIDEVSKGKLSDIPIYTPEDTDFTKPNTSFYKFILNDLDLSPKNSIIVGDAKADMELASRLGVEGIWFTVNKTDLKSADAFTNVHITDDYDDMTKHLKEKLGI